jgi:hypothetical protein
MNIFQDVLYQRTHPHRFLKLFQVVAIVVRGGILRLMAIMLGASRLLEMVKDIDGLRPIAISKVFL